MRQVVHVHMRRHEIVGVVTAVGAEVDTFKVGDLAGVGCMVDSCRKCAQRVPHSSLSKTPALRLSCCSARLAVTCQHSPRAPALVSGP